MLSDPELDDLRSRLDAAGYTLDAVLDRLGECGRRGLDRNSTTPARDALNDTAPEQDAEPQSALIRLNVLQDAVPEPTLRRALGPSLDALRAAGFLATTADGRLRAAAVIRPYGAEATASTQEIAGWICHDPLPNLDGQNRRPRPDHVLGISPASTTLAQISVRNPVQSVLDLGTGCGVQALHLATHAERIVATDLNPRALELARVSLRLSQVDAVLRLGSLYDPVAGETFDQIVSNPPFVISPPSPDARLTYREGDLPGDELVRRVLVDGARHLAPQGTMQLLTNWAITSGQPWDERLASWVAQTGCDALVLQRETLDPYEYAEIWLADAGLDHAPDHAQRYRDWLDYLAAHKIVSIGMGWISLRNAGRANPNLRFDHWPFDVHQPVGAALAAQHGAVDAAQRTDEALLATHWRLAPGVVQETLGRPGAPDPEHIVLRQSSGLGRATEVDTAVAALVGACDGDLSASEIIDALGTLLEVDAEALRAELTPRVRELVADGYLTA